MSGGWIGVDLDGTLAQYDGWRGAAHIGEPVPAMLERVRQWLADGTRVKIFTARAGVPSELPHVRYWLEEQGIGGLEITNVKDYGMIELWDDRVVSVERNTGRVLTEGRPD